MPIVMEEFERALLAWPEPPIGQPPGRPPVDGGTDDPPPSEPQILRSDLEGMTLGILYRDAGGASSERTIRCHVMERSGGILYIKAHCKMRDASRTFRFDRITAVVDYTTGEVTEDVEGFFAPFIADLRQISAAKRAEAPRRAEAPMLQLYGAGATALAFVAAADGHIHPAEMARIADYIDRKLAPMRGDRVQRDLSRQWLRNLLPTRDMAIKAMRKVAADPEDAALVAEALVDLIAADGIVTDEEMQASHDLVKILARRERRDARG